MFGVCFFLKTDMMRRGELKIAKKTQTRIILSQMVPSIFNQEYHNVLRSVFNLFSFSRGQPNLNSLVKLDYIGWRKDFLVVSDVHSADMQSFLFDRWLKLLLM